MFPLELTVFYNIQGNDNIGQIKVLNNTPTRFYYLKDHLGNIKMRVNAWGTSVGVDDYYPFGSLMPNRSSVSSSADSRYKFTGKERDVETGYDYFGARYYDSKIGRWLQVDPLGKLRPGLSPYNYSQNNPINRFDPDGKKDFKVTVRSYIPFQRVGPFWGDNRGPMFSGGTYRTEQTIRIETNPNKSNSPLISKSENTGLTIMDTPTGIITGKGEGKFSTTVSRAEANGGDNAIIDVSGSAAIPLIPFAPAIDYELSISITPGEAGQDNVSIEGAHDGFPAYEIYIESEGEKPRLIYDYRPNDPILGPRFLFPPLDIEVGK